MQNKDNNKADDGWLSIVQEKRMEKCIVENASSVLLC
jgi:hypothetical protein